jgi:hypothetical protein
MAATGDGLPEGQRREEDTMMESRTKSHRVFLR